MSVKTTLFRLLKRFGRKLIFLEKPPYYTFLSGDTTHFSFTYRLGTHNHLLRTYLHIELYTYRLCCLIPSKTRHKV